MNKETLFWLVFTLTAIAALGFLLGQSDGEPPFNTADDERPFAIAPRQTMLSARLNHLVGMRDSEANCLIHIAVVLNS